jgi:hypothetical protein
VPDEEDAVGKLILWIAVSCIANAAETITVHIYNVTGAHAGVIAKGEREASRVFERAGIAVRWSDCPVFDPSRGSNQVCNEQDGTCSFSVVINDTFEDAEIKDTAMGFALPFSEPRNHAAIVYPRLEKLVNANPGVIDRGGLLGAVLAHEIAHLLLGSNRHGPGIMLANWTPAELKRIGHRDLLFTPEQAAALRTGLGLRYSSSEAELQSLESYAKPQ